MAQLCSRSSHMFLGLIYCDADAVVAQLLQLRCCCGSDALMRGSDLAARLSWSDVIAAQVLSWLSSWLSSWLRYSRCSDPNAARPRCSRGPGALMAQSLSRPRSDAATAQISDALAALHLNIWTMGQTNVMGVFCWDWEAWGRWTRGRTRRVW